MSVAWSIFAGLFPAAILTALILAACGGGHLQPVDLYPEDACANCRMAVSEKRFASEILDREGNALKFDDFGCLLRYVSNATAKEKAAAWFVMDYSSRTWCDAKSAWYVRSDSYRTPMGSGIVAFRDRSLAEAAAAQAGVPVRTFADLVR